MDYFKNILCVQFSALIAETITYPLDYVKTQMQLNTSRKSVVKNIKYNQIYNGLTPALKRHMTYTTMRINIYDNIRNNQFVENNILNKIIIGGTAGGVSQFFASPFDLLKIRFMTGNKTTLTNIIKKEGVFKLWRGSSANVSRAILVNLGELSTYDLVKNYIKTSFNTQDNTGLHIISSLFSGFAATLCCTPADVIKSRLMTNNSEYSGPVDCIKKTISKEGVLAMYKGFIPIYMRLAPWQILFWSSYEKFRFYSGLEPF